MKENILYELFGAEDYQKLVGFTIVNAFDTADEDGNELVGLELQNDFGAYIDVSISGGEIHANQPYVKKDR